MRSRLTVFGAVTLGVLLGASAPARGHGPTAHECAARALSESDWINADLWLRAILRETPDDPDAASALRSIYEQPGVDIPIDEAALARATALVGPGFSVTKTEHFVILSNCGTEWTTAKAGLLERTYKQYGRMMDRLGLQWTPPRHRMLCVLIKDHPQYAAFAREHDGVSAPWVGGYYAGASNRVVFYDDITGPAYEHAIAELDEYDELARESRTEARKVRDERAAVLDDRADRILSFTQGERRRLEVEAARTNTAKTIHEAIHMISYNCGMMDRSRLFPFWLSEGLACSFETEESTEAFGPDRESPAREEEWREIVEHKRVIPLELLVTLTDVPADDRVMAEAMYAESYALFSYLYRFRREELAAYVRAVEAEPRGRARPERLLELFESHFGSPGALQRRLERR